MSVANGCIQIIILKCLIRWPHRDFHIIVICKPGTHRHRLTIHSCSKRGLKFLYRLKTLSLFFGQSFADDRLQFRIEHIELGRFGQMLHQDFTRRFPIERHLTRQHFVSNHTHRINIDARPVTSPGYFRSHVINGPHTLRMGTALRRTDEFGQADIRNFQMPVIPENIRWLQITMYQPAIMQKAESLASLFQNLTSLLTGHTGGIFFDRLRQCVPGNVLHQNPVVAVGIGFHIKNRHQIRMAQIQTLRNTTKLNLHVVVQKFKRNFLPGIGQGIVNLTKTATMDRSLDGHPLKWLISG